MPVLVDVTNAVNSASPLARGLLGWWLALPPIDAGKTWYDIAHYHNLAMSGGAVFGNNANHGLFGSVDCPGSTSIAIAANTSSRLVLGNNGTISMWIRPTDGASASHLPASGYGSATSDGWFFNQFAFSIWVYWKSGSPSVQANDTLALNTWAHICCSNIAGALTMYVNGVARATGTSGGSITVAPKITIGATQASALLFQGQADDLQIRDYGMNAAEVAALYADSLARYPLLLNRLPAAETLSGGQFVGPDVALNPFTSLIA